MIYVTKYQEIIMTDYKLIGDQIASLAEAERDAVALLSNASALIYHSLENVNWAGFYLMDKGSLLLGPFQGKVACVRIQVGRGVCGTAVKENKTLVVDDVHQFPGHIACDSASNSEIVIPVHKDGAVIGVLDIDSEEFKRFTDRDREGLESVVKTIEKVANFSKLI